MANRFKWILSIIISFIILGTLYLIINSDKFDDICIDAIIFMIFLYGAYMIKLLIDSICDYFEGDKW